MEVLLFLVHSFASLLLHAPPPRSLPTSIQLKQIPQLAHTSYLSSTTSRILVPRPKLALVSRSRLSFVPG